MGKQIQADFYKYQALGNDMVVIDPAQFDLPLTSEIVRLMCDRHVGLGADGVCYGPLGDDEHPHKMRFLNPDGSPAEKSGNGLRIFARYLWDRGYAQSRVFEIWISGESIIAEVADSQARTLAMALGRLSFNSANIPVDGPAREVVNEPMYVGGAEFRVTAAAIGNPHCVIFADDDLAALARRLGPEIETAPQFPHRTNVQFVRVLNRRAIQIEIWERGAGYTLASGTSACAAAGAAIKIGRCDSPVTVQMAGGAAHVAIDAQWQVTLTGSVEAVCKGRFADDLVARFAGRRPGISEQ